MRPGSRGKMNRVASTGSSDGNSSDEASFHDASPNEAPARMGSALAGRQAAFSDLSAEERMPSPILRLEEETAEAGADYAIEDVVNNAIGEQQSLKAAASTLTQYRDRLSADQARAQPSQSLSPYGANPNFAGDLQTPKDDAAAKRSRFESMEFDRDANPDETDDDDGNSSAGSLGEWEEAERQVIDDEELQHETGNRAGQWISDGARPASLPWASPKTEVIETVKEIVPAKGIQPVHVAPGGAQGPVGPAQCNEKCVNTEAGEAWNKFESAKGTQALMGMLTVLALFGDDIRVLVIQKDADQGWSVLTLLILIIFGVEWAGNSTFQRNYFMSLFFFLDLMATLSLIPDIHWVGDDFYGVAGYHDTAATVCEPGWPEDTEQNGNLVMELNDQDGTAAETAAIARTGRSARIGARAARIVRIMRLCRVLRVFRMMRFVQSVNDEENEEDEMRANPTVIGKRVSAKASQRVVLIVLGVFVATTLSHTLIAVDTDLSPVVGLAFLQAAPEWAGEVGAQANTTLLSAAENFLALTEDVVCLKDVESRLSFAYDTERLEELRNQELALYWSEDSSTLAVIDVRQTAVDSAFANIICILMILAILVATSAILTHDSEAIVVAPISRIIESVKKMEKTLSYLTDADGESLEMQRIAGAMDKMALLLKIGFGDAGNAIISKNLVGGKRLDVMLPGRHVTAIFGFCDIRKFTDTTEVLRAQVMPFVNFCASIVHGTAKRYGGNPNKNVGDAFLIVWKTETFDKIDPMTAAIAARDDPTINLAPITSGAAADAALQRTKSQEGDMAKQQASRRRRLSLGPNQMNEMLETMAIQEMLKESAEEEKAARMEAGIKEPQPEPEPEPSPIPGLKQPRKREKRRARPRRTTAENDSTDGQKMDVSAAADAFKRNVPASPAMSAIDHGETPRFRKTYDAPERDTPRSPGPALANLVGDIENAGMVPPPEKKSLARGDSTEKPDETLHDVEVPGGSKLPSSEADNALQCFLEVIAQIAEKRTEIILRRKLPRLFMAYPNYRLALGFGLHHGWAIEGSLGSMHKVDASYLSPHVTLSDTLEAATKQYGIPILMSGQFVKILSREWWGKCRMVDRVQLAGAGDSRRRVYELWTCDHHNQSIIADKRYKFFLSAFRTAVLLYVQGHWDACKDKLEECLQLKEKDGPSKKLMTILRTHDYQAPEGWKGFRILE